MEVASRSVHDEKALFDEDDETEEDEVVLKRPDAPAEATKIETSKQRQISASKAPPKFEGLRTPAAGHHVQDIRELMTVPVSDGSIYLCGEAETYCYPLSQVIVTADLTKSPPVIKVYSVNPYASKKA